MTQTTAASTPSVWRQPAQVWAVAFACVVAFMGIGLVDPILPAIAESLEASPVETELLFTSYLLVTGLAMLVTSWVSSRIGAKATLLVGLALIVVFALLCALSGSVDAVIGFGRAGASATRCSSPRLSRPSSGQPRAAAARRSCCTRQPWVWASPWVRCSAASSASRAGAAPSSVSSCSWRSRSSRCPCCCAARAKRTPVPFSAPFTALRRPALAILAVAALFYNIGFFVLLAFSPFPWASARWASASPSSAGVSRSR